MDIFINCCSEIVNRLPKAELPFIPALIIGTSFSFFIMALAHQKFYKQSFWKSCIQMIKDLFFHVPKGDHTEFVSCKNESCIKCKRSENLKHTIINVWRKLNLPNQETEYSRITYGIRKLMKITAQISETNCDNDSNTAEKKQKPTIFFMNLKATSSYWTHFNCYNLEKDLLEINFNIIKDEFQQIFKSFQKGYIDGWKRNDIPSGHWCIFPIVDQGQINEENCMKCPNTSALLGSLPSFMKDCVFGNAFFSLLYPESHIEPHYGPTNIRLRCHLSIQVPKKCWLEVDGAQLKWEEGKCLIFDDSYEHSAYYGSNTSSDFPRVVLLMDFWHASITPAEKQILLKLLKPDFF